MAQITLPDFRPHKKPEKKKNDPVISNRLKQMYEVLLFLDMTGKTDISNINQQIIEAWEECSGRNSPITL